MNTYDAPWHWRFMVIRLAINPRYPTILPSCPQVGPRLVAALRATPRHVAFLGCAWSGKYQQPGSLGSTATSGGGQCWCAWTGLEWWWMFMGIYNGYKMLKLWCYWISEIINGFELIYDIDGYYCIIYCSKKTIGDEADPSSGGLDWWLQPSGLGWLFGKWWLVGTWWFFREVSSIECRSHHPLFLGFTRPGKRLHNYGKSPFLMC